MSLAVFLAVACSSGPAGPPVPPASGPDTVTVTRRVTASVLIAAQPRDASVPIKSVRVSPNLIVLARGDKVEPVAQAYGADGRPLADVDFVWSVADPRAGTVTKEKGFRAGSTPGVFKDALSVTGVQNTAEGIRHATAKVSVTVLGERTASRLASVAIIPKNPTVLSGQIYRLRAASYDDDGLLIPGVSFVWQLNEPALGRVNSLGYLTVEGQAGTVRGAVTVTGIWRGMKASATTDVTVVQTPGEDDFISVQVLPDRFQLDPGQRMQVRAVALNGLGELVTGTELRWSMADPRAGTIDGSGRFVAGKAPGIFTEAVRAEAIVPGEQGFVRAVDFASVVIRGERSSRRLEVARVVPESAVVAPGSRLLVVVEAADELGNPVYDYKASWEVTRDGVGEVDDHGIFTATGGPGRYPGAVRVSVVQKLRDEVITRTSSADVVVTGTLAQAEVHPSLATVSPGRTAHFRVIGRDENGTELPGLLVLWSVSDPTVGTVDAFGNFTAGKVAGIYQDVIQAEVRQTLPRPR